MVSRSNMLLQLSCKALATSGNQTYSRIAMENPSFIDVFWGISHCYMATRLIAMFAIIHIIEYNGENPSMVFMFDC